MVSGLLLAGGEEEGQTVSTDQRHLLLGLQQRADLEAESLPLLPVQAGEAEEREESRGSGDVDLGAGV